MNFVGVAWGFSWVLGPIGFWVWRLGCYTPSTLNIWNSSSPAPRVPGCAQSLGIIACRLRTLHNNSDSHLPTNSYPIHSLHPTTSLRINIPRSSTAELASLPPLQKAPKHETSNKTESLILIVRARGLLNGAQMGCQSRCCCRVEAALHKQQHYSLIVLIRFLTKSRPQRPSNCVIHLVVLALQGHCICSVVLRLSIIPCPSEEEPQDPFLNSFLVSNGKQPSA